MTESEESMWDAIDKDSAEETDEVLELEARSPTRQNSFTSASNVTSKQSSLNSIFSQISHASTSATTAPPSPSLGRRVQEFEWADSAERRDVISLSSPPPSPSPKMRKAQLGGNGEGRLRRAETDGSLGGGRKRNMFMDMDSDDERTPVAGPSGGARREEKVKPLGKLVFPPAANVPRSLQSGSSSALSTREDNPFDDSVNSPVNTASMRPPPPPSPTKKSPNNHASSSSSRQPPLRQHSAPERQMSDVAPPRPVQSLSYPTSSTSKRSAQTGTSSGGDTSKGRKQSSSAGETPKRLSHSSSSSSIELSSKHSAHSARPSVVVSSSSKRPTYSSYPSLDEDFMETESISTRVPPPSRRSATIPDVSPTRTSTSPHKHVSASTSASTSSTRTELSTSSTSSSTPSYSAHGHASMTSSTTQSRTSHTHRDVFVQGSSKDHTPSKSAPVTTPRVGQPTPNPQRSHSTPTSKVTPGTTPTPARKKSAPVPLPTPSTPRAATTPSSTRATSKIPLTLPEPFSLPRDTPLDLPAVEIAHSLCVQKDLENLSWGVQWEIARGVTNGLWSFDDVTSEKCKLLVGSNAQAAFKVPAVILGKEIPQRPNDKMVEILAEMDREQAAVIENKGRGLGLMGEWQGKENWYGGKVEQLVVVVNTAGDKEPPRYEMRLQKLDMRKSNRFRRFLSSRRVLRVKYDSELLHKPRELSEFLSQKFVICGRVFVAFHAKEGVFMMETREDYERRSSHFQGDQHRMSFDEFVEWYNPLGRNNEQPISKWSARLALGLSTSVPVLQFLPENIYFIEDEHAEDSPTEGKIPAECIMTDGCGFMNAAALLEIGKVMKYASRPMAVQGRVAGSKGLWILHPELEHHDPTSPPRIWIRDSQRKIKLPPFETINRAHLIFDLLSPSRVTFPGRLSRQILLNLYNNGVPVSVFKPLLTAGIDSFMDGLTKWDGPHAALKLHSTVDKAGSVSYMNLQRMAAGASRALGFGRDKDENGVAENYDVDSDEELSPASVLGPDAPESASAAALAMIAAGFHPKTCPVLYEKLKFICANKVESFIKDYHIEVPESAEAYVVPDPFGVLEEGTVHFKCSENIKDAHLDMYPNYLQGEILISRNPCRVASDVQKVMAVRHDKLANFLDVLVVSTKGKRSQASYLGGGDTVLMNWNPGCVASFTNAPLVEMPPNFIDDNFEREVTMVNDFFRESATLPHAAARKAFQKVLLLGLLSKEYVGTYSSYHDLAIHQLGYSDPRTVRLSYMFTTCLDSDKTGLRPKPLVLAEDKERFNRIKPSCMQAVTNSDFIQPEGYKMELPRAPGLPLCPLCLLGDIGKDHKDRCLGQYEGLNDEVDRRLDRDLTAPWDKATASALQMKVQGFPQLEEELKRVESHIKSLIEPYNKIWQPSSPSKSSTSKSGKAAKATAKSKQEAADKIIRQYIEGPPLELLPGLCDIKLLKASCAYKLTHPKPFGFSVALWDLCSCKATAQPRGRASITHDFQQAMTIPSSILRVLAQRDTT
ncbi:hypothetical protein JAAARDRAFT_53096 [Jaapia argillacea MUCL 33604]|uniref:RDRP core domain-containing protein n=1 Tax=Jaapia argillacea MUCL 33604 TaxID=933084 RepID=A0A067Q7A5_9AGAM|nr:hypothetical protein JAAARDRAFT_53096 [Jaapia argillacea MUCL 33604]